MDDALALELGAPILASAPCVSVRADGAKIHIGSRCGQLFDRRRERCDGRGILGDERLRHRGMVQAHGTVRPRTGSPSRRC
ncbi:MAG: hypothetical protein CM15mP74_06880 [Halieaceae bacterium]|nr:MAG: hypothetical protein CM15mP74_06880 [Halieaceae bacterium]